LVGEDVAWETTQNAAALPPKLRHHRTATIDEHATSGVTCRRQITIPSIAAVVLHVRHNAQKAAPRTNIYLAFAISLNWKQLRQTAGVV